MAISAESLEYIRDPIAKDKEAKLMPEMNKNKNKSVAKWFLGFTSIGGLAQVNSSDQRLSKSVWSFVFVIGAVATLWNFIGVWEDYFSNQVITTVTQNFDDVMAFPAITMCNFNKVHCRNLYDHIRELNNSTNDNSNSVSERIYHLCTIYNGGTCALSISTDDMFAHGEVKLEPICENASLFHKVNLDIFVMDEEVVTEALNSVLYRLPMEDKIKIAQQPNQFIRRCRFNSKYDHEQCAYLMNSSNAIFSPNMGTCYSFNYRPPSTDRNQGKAAESVLAGELYSLELEINLDSDLYLSNALSPRLGARVAVHEPEHYPILSKRGYGLAPGYMHTISMDRHLFSRQPSPYPSECYHEWSEEAKLPQSIKDSIPYDASLCQSFCMDAFVQSDCGCTVLSVIELDRNLSKPCDILDPVVVDCVLNAFDNVTHMTNTLEDKCQNCKPQCEEYQYKATISSSSWPSPSYWVTLASRYGLTYNGTTVDAEFAEGLHAYGLGTAAGKQQQQVYNGDIDQMKDELRKHIRDNFLMVRIYYDSKATNNIIETPKYTGYDTILSSLGGAISLYLGMSFVSICELIEFSIRSIAACVNRKNP